MTVSKMITLSLSAALIASAVGVAGCGRTTTTDNNTLHTKSTRNYKDGHIKSNSLGKGTYLNDRQSNKITNMKHSPTLSNKVAQLSDVQTSHVVVTDRDAYVAVTLHNKAGNGHYSGLSTNHNRGTNYINQSGTYTGSTTGTYRTGSTDGVGRRMTTGSANAGSLMGTGRDMIFGDKARNGMNTYQDINQGTNYGGNYGTNNGTSYGNGTTYGTGTNGGTNYGTTADRMNPRSSTGTVVDNVPQKVKDEITRVVKQSDPNIRNVYVSNHPDFVSSIGNYVTNSRGGTMLENTMTDFQKMVDRIFPSRAGTMTGPSGLTPTNRTGDYGVTR